MVDVNFFSFSESEILYYGFLGYPKCFFSECLELFPNFGHISVDLGDVIPLVVSDVHSLRKFIYLFILSLRVLLSELVAWCLPEMHDETHK